jgi:hypothetical protein
MHVHGQIFWSLAPNMTGEELMAGILPLWEQSLGVSDGLRLIPGPVSGNNRVFIAETTKSRALVKWYFRGPPKSRNRMKSEWQMLAFTRAAGIAFAPCPLACDEERGLALMEWIEGETLGPMQVTSREISSAAEFVRQLNCIESRPYSAELPDAAEACFTTISHLEVMQARLDRLAFTPQNDLDLRAEKLLKHMRQFWNHIRPLIADELQRLGVDAGAPIPRTLQCLSPADFGFHNAIRQRDGSMRFFDFEYAGWDDPAKTLCDFFLAPAVTVPLEFWNDFAASAFAEWPPEAAIRERAAILMPLFALKWCCIMLNPFVPSLASPGRFAAPVQDVDGRKELQINKAELAFATLVERNAGLSPKQR